MLKLSTPIETARCIIRPCKETDFESLAALLSDPEVMRYSLKGPIPREEVQPYMGRLGFWGLFSKEDGHLLGIAGLKYQQIDGVEELEVGYRLACAEWGKGFATEAASAIRDFAFREVGVNHLISIISPDNTASVAVARRIGMRKVKSTNFHGFAVDIYQVHPVRLSDYHPEWPELFQKERESLLSQFERQSVEIMHIGSTAIVGAKAKPVIDILIRVNQFSMLDPFYKKLEALGYTLKGECGVRGRLFAQKKGKIWYHLHFFEEDNPEVARHLRFVAYLNDHHKMREAYVALKEKLALQFVGDRHSYTMKKSALIKEIDYMAAKAADMWLKLPPLGPKKRIWTEEEIIEALDANTYLQMTFFAKYIPAREILPQPDVTVIQAPKVFDDTFNVIFGARFDGDFGKRIQNVVALYRERGLPFSWWVGPCDLPPSLSDELKSQGLVCTEENVAMYKELVEKVVCSSDLSWKRVLNEESLREFDAVHVGTGGNPDVYDTLFRPIPPVLYSEGAPFELYIGYHEGQAVVTGVVVFHAHVAGIYYIVTLPEHRRKGYATAMMQTLMNRAYEKGYAMAILHASPMGQSLYARLGFTPCASYHEFALRQ